MTNGTRKSRWVGQIRSKLENAILALVGAEELLPLIRLRIEQSLTQTGMASLLNPAIGELERIETSLQSAKAQLKDATQQLLEK